MQNKNELTVTKMEWSGYKYFQEIVVEKKLEK